MLLTLQIAYFKVFLFSFESDLEDKPLVNDNIGKTIGQVTGIIIYTEQTTVSHLVGHITYKILLRGLTNAYIPNKCTQFGESILHL